MCLLACREQIDQRFASFSAGLLHGTTAYLFFWHLQANNAGFQVPIGYKLGAEPPSELLRTILVGISAPPWPQLPEAGQRLRRVT